VIVSNTKIDTYYFNESLVKFFKAGDEEDLAQCMFSMISDRDARERLTKNSLQFIQGQNWATKKHEYLELVDGLANNDPRKNI
jgi:hypothetical protein